MVSVQGKSYLFAWEMLYSALQIYYIWEDPYDMPNENYRTWISESRIPSWGSAYGDIIGWAVEEAATPSHFETRDEIGTLYSLAEEVSYAVWNVDTQFFELALNYEETYKIAAPCIHYVMYCLWVLQVMTRFRILMEADLFRESRYYQNYKETLPAFDEAAHEILSSVSTQRGIVGDTHWEHLEQQASLLADEWLTNLHTAINQS